MKKILPFITVFVILGFYANAGENKYLGRIRLLSDGGATTNVTTATTTDAGGAPFNIPLGAKITVIASDGVGILTDNNTCTPVSAMQISGQTIFPTSVGSAQNALPTYSDGGGPFVQTAVICVISKDAGGYGATVVDVWNRAGTE
jgi:hypothetical protein